MPLPHDPFIEITRSFSYRLNVGNWQSADFFVSRKEQCATSQAETVSAALHDFCRIEVMRAVKQFHDEGEREYAEIEQRATNGQPPARKPEENPFQVSEAPKTEAPAPVQAGLDPAVVALEKADEIPGVKSRTGELTKPTPPAEVIPQSRGRGKKAQPPEPPPQAPAQPTEGYQAQQDDVPAIIGGKPETAPAPSAPGPKLVKPEQTAEQTQLAAFARIGAALQSATGLDAERVKKSIRDPWLRAFLNVSRLERPPKPQYEVAIQLLDQLTKPEYIQDLARDPHSMGVAANAGWNRLIRLPWETPELAEAAKVLAIERFPEDGGDGLCEWLSKVVVKNHPNMTPSDMLILFKVYRVTRSALQLLEPAFAKGRTLSEITKGLNLETATEKDVLTLLANGAPPAEEPPPSGKENLWD